MPNAGPREKLVWYRGAPYMHDLSKCRRALVMRQVEGELDNMNSLAKAVGVSRSTASRFFAGRSTSLAVTLRILAVLRLVFDEVMRPVVVVRANSYTVVLEPDGCGGYTGTVPALPGCFTRGTTMEEAREHMVEAITVHIAGLVADGLPVPADYSNGIDVDGDGAGG
jgi:antitoxin HicB